MRPVILIVDDEEGIVEVLAEVFTLNEFDVLTARDGLQALAVLSINTPDIILSDLRMPNCDGKAFYETTRSNPITSQIPFIFLTATPEAVLKLDASAVLQKPFLLEELLKEVDKALI